MFSKVKWRIFHTSGPLPQRTILSVCQQAVEMEHPREISTTQMTDWETPLSSLLKNFIHYSPVNGQQKYLMHTISCASKVAAWQSISQGSSVMHTGPALLHWHDRTLKSSGLKPIYCSLFFNTKDRESVESPGDTVQNLPDQEEGNLNYLYATLVPSSLGPT